MKKNICILFLIPLFISCFHTQVLQKEKITEGRILEISITTFKYKGEKFKQLDGIIRGADGRLSAQYYVSTKCGCIGKKLYAPKITRFDLTSTTVLVYPLTEEDKLVFSKFLSLPDIEMYCSKSMLDSARGFVKHK